MDEIKQGATVQFKGGLGRSDDPRVIHTGIVNGPVGFDQRGECVPVHVPEINHNLIVASANIVKVVTE